MTIKRQADVVAQIEARVRVTMRRMEEDAAKRLQLLWDSTAEAMRGVILSEYHRDFRNEPWTLAQAQARGTLLRIEKRTKSIMRTFAASAIDLVRQAKRETWQEEALRAMYMLDITTPKHVAIKAPAPRAFREAGGILQSMTGAPAKAGWNERFAAWADAYGSQLNLNLKLGSLNQSAPADAADEVAATRPGSPAVSFNQIIDRILRVEVIDAEARAREDVKDANPEVVAVEIWQAMADGRVCPLCESQDGQAREDCTEEIPAHPLCRCFYRLVPKDWADLMRSGDKDFARKLDSAGLVPDAMVIFDGAGQPAAAITVDFTAWRDGMPQQVVAR